MYGSGQDLGCDRPRSWSADRPAVHRCRIVRRQGCAGMHLLGQHATVAKSNGDALGAENLTAGVRPPTSLVPLWGDQGHDVEPPRPSVVSGTLPRNRIAASCSEKSRAAATQARQFQANRSRARHRHPSLSGIGGMVLNLFRSVRSGRARSQPRDAPFEGVSPRRAAGSCPRGNKKGTNPGPPDRTRRTRRTTNVLRTPPLVLNSTAANCGPPFGTKRPQVQILSPRPVFPQVRGPHHSW
jgi:hypothetical protein